MPPEVREIATLGTRNCHFGVSRKPASALGLRAFSKTGRYCRYCRYLYMRPQSFEKKDCGHSSLFLTCSMPLNEWVHTVHNRKQGPQIGFVEFKNWKWKIFVVWHDLSPQAPPLLDRAGKGLRFYAPKANLLYRDINAVRGNSERLRTMRDFLIHRSRAGDLD